MISFCIYLHSYFRNSKTLDALLFLIYSFLINERSNSKIISKILELFTYLCDKPVFGRKIYNIVFQTEKLVKKTKQLLKIFNDMNLNYDDLSKKLINLTRFSPLTSQYFPKLCKFFVRFLNVSLLIVISFWKTEFFFCLKALRSSYKSKRGENWGTIQDFNWKLS